MINEIMSCQCCGTADLELSLYELKAGGQCSYCIVCENTYEYYLDHIKRNCLLNGVAYELSTHDKKIIENEKKLRLENMYQIDELSSKGIYYFSNEPVKDVDMNYQAMKYVNYFLDKQDHDTEHLQRFKFKKSIGRSIYIGNFDGLTDVRLTIDTVNKTYEKVKKQGETEYRERVRKWYSGRFECNEDFYNCTFGFSQIDENEYGSVYVNYDFLCSKTNRISKLVESVRDRMLKT